MVFQELTEVIEPMKLGNQPFLKYIQETILSHLKLTLQLLPKLSCIIDTNREFGRLSYLEVHVCLVLKSLSLQPHTNQTKITLWCSRDWWGPLAWHTKYLVIIFRFFNHCMPLHFSTWLSSSDDQI